MKDFDNFTLKQIREMDLNVVRDFLNDNKEFLSYNKDSQAWFIEDTEVVDELYYDIYTIIHPKEIIGYVEDIIENEMGLRKDDS